MKAFCLSLFLAVSSFVVLAVSFLRPSVSQFVVISTLAFGLQLLGTWVVLYYFRPIGISRRQAAVVVWGSLAWLGVLVALGIGWRQHPFQPFILVTDSAIQTEVALQYLAEGRNPYVENYYGTELEKYPYPKRLALTNPALEHFVYLPTLVWLSYPVYELAQWGLGFFDQRFMLLLATLALVWLVWHELKWKPEVAILLAPCLMVSPWFAYNLLAGQNDVLPLMMVTGALLLWHRRMFTAGTIVLALAATTKQTVWFVLPFAAMYLWQTYGELYGRQFGRRFFYQLAWFGLAALTSLAPFLIWDASALWHDTVGYILGATNLTYPIWGVGIGEMIVQLGIVSSRQATWPFVWLQLAVAIPLLIALLYQQRRLKPNLAYVMAAWGLWLGASWLAGRFFAPAHLGFIITVWAIACLLHYSTLWASPTQSTFTYVH